MKKKRILAVIMALVVLMASVPGLSVQADSISKEAQACKELGILIGADSSGVTSQYLSTEPTRIQAFIILLRLKGLYDEATEYNGDNNFKDASTAGWAKNYMAYAKDHSELGWNGYPDGTFAPGDKINGQAFYKVMLETLGYKQNIDFSYADTLKFAAKKGLIKKAEDISKLDKFTVDDVAKGIVSTLNAKPSDSDKKLISVMVEKGIITADKAVASGFTLDTKDAKVIGFNAISNNRIQVEFDNDIFLQKADVEITQVGGSSRLSVLSVESEGNKAIISTTEAKPFNAYELSINTMVPTNNMVVRGYKKKFVAMPKDTVKPTAKHEVTGRNEIVITFSEEMDRNSAENPDNYMIEGGAEVLSADLNESGKIVTLKTTDITRFYKLVIQNVCDVSGNRMDRYSVLFEGGKSDTQGPSVVNVRSENNTSVTVTFNERVDRYSAEDTYNYSADNGLSITGAQLDDSGRVVTLLTSIQDSGTVYNLTVQGVADTWGNTMYRKDFRFVSDSTRPAISVMAISNNEVRVTFSKKMDKESAEDISNYSIDKGLEVKDAFLDESGKVVTLITSSQTLRELYTLTIMQVYDAWGNMSNIFSAKFGGMPVDNKELAYTVKSNGNEIIVTFNKRVDKETAEDVFNYVLDDSLGYAAKATLDDSGRVVTLLTANHSSGKMYSITVENVQDIFGNEISSDEKVSKKRFAGIGSSKGTGSDVLVLESVIAVNVNTIDLMFSNELTEEELDEMRVKLDVPEEYNYRLPSGIDYYKYFIGGKKNVRVQFETNSSKNPSIFESGSFYEVEVTRLDRLDSKNDANIKLFAGTSYPNEAPEVLEVNALNSTAVEVVFSEPVKGITKSQFDIRDKITITGVSVEDKDEITDRVLLYISSSTKLDDDNYRLYVKSGVKDAAGLNSVKIGSGSSSSYVEFYGNSDDNEAPFVESDVIALDSYTIQFEFNEAIKDITNSSFSVKRTSGSSSTLNISKAVLSDDRKVVTLYLNSRNAGLDSDYEYELIINSSVRDLQDMRVDNDSRKIKFDGVDIDIEELEIVGSYINDDNDVITLLTNRELNISNLTMDDFKLSGAGYYKSSSDDVKYDNKSITISLKNELDSGEDLTIEITSTGRSRIKDYNNQELTTKEIVIETN